MPSETQVFIVRLWKERPEVEENAVRWRGSVERVPTAERKFINGLSEIEAVIGTFLEDPDGHGQQDPQ